MRIWRAVLTVASLCAMSSAVLAGPPSSSRRHARPTGTRIEDSGTRIDINEISMIVKNTGSFAFDTDFASAGLEFPNGSGNTAVFAGGLWVGALDVGGPRVSVAEYSDDYRPGMAVGGVPEAPESAALKVYKLLRVYPDATSRDAALADYNNGAVPRGAPPVSVLVDGTLGIAGDQMLWSVYNDLGKGAAHTFAGSDLPLGLEVQHTTWAYNRPGVLGHTLFMRYRLINRSSNTLNQTRVALWSDPDLGGYDDDLVGCDPALGLGFCYNATNADAQYGATPPAVGFDLLRGPSGTVAPSMRAFNRYVNGTDPQDSTETYNLMQGLNSDGSPQIDPVTTLATTYAVPGDPVANTGWLDSSPADRRMMLTSQPFTLAPGGANEVVCAIIVAQGSDRLSSVTLLKAEDQVIQTAFDANTIGTLDAPEFPMASLALAAPWPNPARGAFTVSYSLPASEDATLELIDVAGRIVLARSLSAQGTGSHSVTLDAPRERLAAGVYFVRLAHAGGQVTRRVVLMP